MYIKRHDWSPRISLQDAPPKSLFLQVSHTSVHFHLPKAFSQRLRRLLSFCNIVFLSSLCKPSLACERWRTRMAARLLARNSFKRLAQRTQGKTLSSFDKIDKIYGIDLQHVNLVNPVKKSSPRGGFCFQPEEALSGSTENGHSLYYGRKLLALITTTGV